MNDIVSFLASSPVFRDMSRDEIARVVPLLRSERHPAGAIVLHQDGFSHAIHFVASGRLAVRVQRGSARETVALLDPPDIFGELSFLTGGPCVADVEVVVDAEVLLLSRDAIDRLPSDGNDMLRGLLEIIAQRLQRTVARGATVRNASVVLLRPQANWGATLVFAAELGRSMARQTNLHTLVVNLGTDHTTEPRAIHEVADVQDLALPARDEEVRRLVAERLTAWRRHGANVVLNAVGTRAAATATTINGLATWLGDLLGPEDALPPCPLPPTSRFVVQDAALPSLPALSGTQQLIREVGASESAFRLGGSGTPAFLRTVDSIARAVSGLQVGLALGGGGAWGWSHVGVLDVLEKAGVPVDVISGCSTGSLIGALRACGCEASALMDIADYWRTRVGRFVEWRFWRMCLINEHVARKALVRHFGNRRVNQTDIPYAANAVDVKTGEEVSIRDGLLVDCVRASSALPGLLPPCDRGDRLLVDGGIIDPIPVTLARGMGCHFAIGVNAMASLASQQLTSRHPMNAFDVMTRCMMIMGHEMGQARAKATADVVFTPDLSDFTVLSFSRSADIVACGRRSAEAHLPLIQEAYTRLRRDRLG